MNSRLTYYCGILHLKILDKNFSGVKTIRRLHVSFRWLDEKEDTYSRVELLESIIEVLQCRNKGLGNNVEELRKKLDEERKLKNEFKKKYESLLLKKTVALYMICVFFFLV